VTVAARTRTDILARPWAARWPIWAEVVLFLGVMVLYEWLRSVVAPGGDDVARAFAHAQDVVDLEKALGLFVEPHIHEWVQGNVVAKFATTWFYTLGYTGGFIAMFAWMWWRRRPYFAAFRNWFWASSLLAVVGYGIYPLAPPRFAGLGLEDPTREALKLGGALDWFQPFRNEFAAMPSMHCGLAILMGLTLFWMLKPSRWRWLALLWPVAMIVTTMATANHWWLDAVGGAVVVGLALALVAPFSRGMPAPWRHTA
jgi:hypothetical protein